MYQKRRIALALTVVFVLSALIAGGYFGISYIQERQRANTFYEGYHDPRTGETGEDIFDFMPEGVQIAYAVYYSGKCQHCHDYAATVVEFWKTVQGPQYRGAVGFVIVNAAMETDAAVKAFAEQHGIPDDLPILAGWTPDIEFLPAFVMEVDGATMVPEGVPALLLIFEDTDGWYTWGFRSGAMPLDEMLYYVQMYLDWRLMQNF